VRGNKRLLHAPVFEIIEKPRGVVVDSWASCKNKEANGHLTI